MSVAAKRMEADKRVGEQRHAIAEQLAARLLSSQTEQLQLFEIERESANAQFREDDLIRLRAKHPGKLILDASLVDLYRYEAAMHGAGFHPSQFDEVTWRENDIAGSNTVYFDALGGWHVHHEPEKTGRPNRMRDEVREQLFTSIVPSTAYDYGMYITNEEDLVAIFESEQINMEACKLISEDVLYEKENI